ncbi:hypothetical protein AW90_49300 [Salmonella enterica subsp. enterica serovar Newport str. CDC 2010K-2159]|nr:hypothetical protein AW90_49300 [Salmonella enterica subsp. enterica serovar Newport str. CDC 2010K-2159]
MQKAFAMTDGILTKAYIGVTLNLQDFAILVIIFLVKACVSQCSKVKTLVPHQFGGFYCRESAKFVLWFPEMGEPKYKI